MSLKCDSRDVSLQGTSHISDNYKTDYLLFFAAILGSVAGAMSLCFVYDKRIKKKDYIYIYIIITLIIIILQSENISG